MFYRTVPLYYLLAAQIYRNYSFLQTMNCTFSVWFLFTTFSAYSINNVKKEIFLSD